MALATGTRIGPYTVTAPIGAGGMGEVYKAIDTRLKRDVALKILPDSVASDRDRLARFQREAEVLASLNHPNIAAIYGLEESNGIRGLVMELVEGPTLADRIAQGPIPVDEALSVAKQIAEALEAAHERGIIHRDLKPANIKVRPDGTVKVLDFGLAKALEPTAATGVDATASPTITSPAMMTGVGMLLGTAAYMSPEQARGKPVDKRSDIWAFGCVVYEMLTGHRAFPGEDVTDTLAAIMRAEPDWTALPVDTNASIRRLLKRCLSKNHRDRLPDIAVARLDISEATTAGPALNQASRSSALAWRVWPVLLVLLVLAVLALVVTRRGESLASANVYHSTISLGAFQTRVLHPALSPDARTLAFVAPDATGSTTLWVRPLDSFQSQPLAGTQGAAAPFWSPDSRFLGFVADGKLKKISATGGPVVVLAEGAVSLPGAWNSDDVIVFTPRVSSPLYRVAATGGPASAVTDIGSENLVHAFPAFLPDGRHFLFLSQSPNGSSPSIALGSLDSVEHKVLIQSASHATFANGYVLFLRETTLMAQAFDAVTLELSGDPTPLASDVTPLAPNLAGAGGLSFSVSATGVLVYQSHAAAPSELAWLDRRGEQLGTLEERGNYGGVWFSPDGAQAALEARGSGLLIFDLDRRLPTRLSEGATYPVWSPDGSTVVFTSRRSGRMDLYLKQASGARAETTLWSDQLDKFPTSWSPDGRFILYTAVSPSTEADVWALSVGNEHGRPDAVPRGTPANGSPFPVVQTRFSERSGQFSPDGRWVAYQSDESGEPEIYVTAFNDTGSAVRVSSRGGSGPQWRSDGKELFFLSRDGDIVAVPVATDQNRLKVGLTQPLFRVRNLARIEFAWDVSPDGQRFLVNVLADPDADRSVALVVNWPVLLGNSTRAR